LAVVDGSAGIIEQDLHVAGYAFERGRAVVLVVNKWDLVEKDHSTMKEFTKDLRVRFSFLGNVPILFVSALTGQRAAKIIKEVEMVAEQFNRRIPTAALNTALREAVEAHQPPIARGRRIKFFYMTQTAVRPPTFVVFANQADGIHFSYQRYLTNKIREAFGFVGVPLRIEYRDRDRKG
jgi:GTP-binding protein